MIKKILRYIWIGIIYAIGTVLIITIVGLICYIIIHSE